MQRQMRRLWSDEDGVVTVEYAMLLALLVVAAMGTWTHFGEIIRNKVATAGDGIDAIH